MLDIGMLVRHSTNIINNDDNDQTHGGSLFEMRLARHGHKQQLRLYRKRKNDEVHVHGSTEWKRKLFDFMKQKRQRNDDEEKVELMTSNE